MPQKLLHLANVHPRLEQERRRRRPERVRRVDTDLPLLSTKSEHVGIGTGSNFVVDEFVTKQILNPKGTAYAQNYDT
jgi:hypothetical protein